ncbi:hypothetical protein E2C01_092204 [Portunus trituberculatus]|uniref:Uncharacterized protein n=1 Tax=Portunus trituberculatus TaxID=210409 RepID=A0A5B7JR49_PORTR|nr:hypothetical protein [Portunus trituberculatus]
MNTTVTPEHLLLHISAFLDLHHNITLHHGPSPG